MNDDKPKKNTRRAFVLRKDETHDRGLYYEEVPFLDIKNGDTFLLVEADGTPVPNRDGSVVCVALEDAQGKRYEYGETDEGEPIWGVRGAMITECASPLKPISVLLSEEPE